MRVKLRSKGQVNSSAHRRRTDDSLIEDYTTEVEILNRLQAWAAIRKDFKMVASVAEYIILLKKYKYEIQRAEGRHRRFR